MYNSMININSDTILMSASELRTEVPKLAGELKVKTIIITKRGKPVAVLEDFNNFKAKNDLIEQMEDLVLGMTAREREKTAKTSDYFSQDVVLKKLGIK
jgi:hypothetical protein